ncbi:SET and MYND domain-containing protein 4-like [Homarus americanus]|uniref:SET and MYND domain-containing protein 4-like n=1 Tax=Homarus americanus TaxID=6706 RepID=UPI001C4899A3|nr:SET and MYND domain-containing protein 4-like [Homarus americanus]
MYNCQPLLDRLTHVLVKTGAIEEFSMKETPLEKIKFCLEKEVIYDTDIKINLRTEIQDLLNALYEKCGDHGKSQDFALQAKNKGSKAYLKKKDAEALNNFTECLSLAPTESTILPLAYANRSAVLFQMGRYEEALQDMNRAEENGYPAALQHKLLTRRCHCYLILGKEDEAKASFDICKKHSRVIPPESKEKYEKAVADLEQKMMDNTLIRKVTNCQDVLHDPSIIKGESSVVKYMTSAFELRVNDKYGRHIVASDDVSKGSVVFMEKPYAAILLPEYHNSHCHTCFTPATNPVPCKDCRDVIFCKEECRDLGQKWHQYECGILHILSSVGIAHLAVRVILVSGWKLCSDIRDEVIEGRVAGVGKNGVYNGTDWAEGYRAVYHLMPHFNKCLPEDQLQYCLAAILLTNAVYDKTDFRKHSEDVMKNDRLEIAEFASAIMRHIAQLVSNAHAVTQIMASSCGEKSKVEQVTQKRVASAIYPTASLMNHSCKPNIINSFHKNMLIIRTVEDVKPGDQIHNCYGPHYCRQTRGERQESLKRQYFFTCKCAPCTQPEYLQKEASWSGFHCENCQGILSWMGDNDDATGGDLVDSGGVLLCLQCHKLQKPSTCLIHTCNKVTSLHEAGEEALQKGDPQGAVDLLRKAVSLGCKVYLPENQYYISIRDTLARALSDIGDFESCCLELRECLRVTKLRYGSESIELAHELLKFSDVLTLASVSNDKFQDEITEVTRRIDEIFTLNYGSQWKTYLRTSCE